MGHAWLLGYMRSDDSFTSKEFIDQLSLEGEGLIVKMTISRLTSGLLIQRV